MVPAPSLFFLLRTKSLGCFTEIISFRTRLFVPRDRVEAILTTIREAPG
jgi:hypothetical protein